MSLARVWRISEQTRLALGARMRCADALAQVRLLVRVCFRKSFFAVAILLGWSSFSGSGLADNAPDPHQAYYFAMRAPSVDPAPRHVAAVPQSDDVKTSPLTADDGATYCLSVADAAATTDIVCLMQADN